MSTAAPAVSPHAASPPTAATGVVDDIGQTPLLRLDSVAADLPETVHLYAKAEHLNPGGSVKDRPALRMIEAGLADGAFHPDQTLIDATSGNTGIAYAMIGAAKGLDVTLALPQNASEERKKVLRAYGAELILTDPMAGTDGAQERVKEIVEAHPDRYFYPDQYNNDANWQAHHDGTGPEILAQTDGQITHFVAGLGTTGTFTGVTLEKLGLERPVDAVVLVYDGLNYLLDPADVRQFFRRAARLVRPGGLVLFDQSTPANSEDNATGFTDEGTEGDFAYVRESTYDPDTRRHVTTFAVSVDGRSGCERHVQRAYAPGEIRTLLADSPLSVEAAYDGFSTDPVQDRSHRVHWVTRRVVEEA